MASVREGASAFPARAESGTADLGKFGRTAGPERAEPHAERQDRQQFDGALAARHGHLEGGKRSREPDQYRRDPGRGEGWVGETLGNIRADPMHRPQRADDADGKSQPLARPHFRRRQALDGCDRLAQGGDKFVGRGHRS